MMVRVHWDYHTLNSILYNKVNSIAKKGAGSTYFNNIFTFDIETSGGYLQSDNHVIPFSHSDFNKTYNSIHSGSILCNDVKKILNYQRPVSLMYVWQCAIENNNDIDVYMGRTWDKFINFLDELDDNITKMMLYNSTHINMSQHQHIMANSKNYKKPKLHFYVHNLGYEMQFLRNVFPNMNKVFARNMRKPMRFEITHNNIIIEFHDTLCLTQKTLENWAKDEKLPVQKLTGNLDYLKIRTPLTPLTQQEIDYCINDVVSMIYGIQKYRAKYGNKLVNIPMTQTGEVRHICRKEITGKNPKWAEQCYMIDHSYTWDFFNRLIQAFGGGWTHANQKFSGKLQGIKVRNQPIVCWDFASSYPSVMTTCKFPVSEFRTIDEARLQYLETFSLDDSPYRFLVVAEFTDVESEMWNSFFSSSKCIELSDDALLDNGKIVAASKIKVCVTDTDYDLLKRTYSFESVKILEAYEADADYLPIEFINVILDYYEGKTKLKGTGNESAYNASKQFINSLYGAAVTKIITDLVEFKDGDWVKTPVDLEAFGKLMEIPEKQKTLENQIAKKFISYQIGVWIPAFARHRLWDAIIQFDNKTIYCDTDSIKGYFDSNDIKWFEDYNKYISSLQEKVANHYNFSIDRFSPKTPKGKEKQLGIFDREDDCLDFKALRAKVYAYKYYDSDSNEYKVKTTIAGLPKKAGTKIITDVDILNDNLYWNPEQAEKLCAHYLDNMPSADWVDENGTVYHSNDRYGIMLEPIGYDLSIASEYKYLLDILNQHDNVDYFDTPEIIRNYWEESVDKN